MSSRSMMSREPRFAYDFLLFTSVLAGIYSSSARWALGIYLISGAAYLALKLYRGPPDHDAVAAELAHGLRLAAIAGVPRERIAEALAPFSNDALADAGPHAPLFEPALRGWGSPEASASYLELVATWLERSRATRAALAETLRPGGITMVVVPTLSVFVFVSQLACIPWAELTRDDPLVPLALVAQMLVWFVGLMWQYRTLENFHDGTPATRTRVAAALKLARAPLAIAGDSRDVAVAPSRALTNILAAPGAVDLPPAPIARGLLADAIIADALACELAVARYRMALVFTRGPAMAMAAAFPLLLVAAALARVVGP